MSDESSADSVHGSPSKWGARWRRLFYRGWAQVGLSLAAAIIATSIAVVVEGSLELTHFPDRTDCITFLAGIASILALVSSLTFGLLLHYLQSVTSERYLLYARFKDDVRDLRTFLDELHADGLISPAYDFSYGLVEEVTLKDFPILDFSPLINPVLDVVTEDERDDLEEMGEFGRVLRGVAYRVNDMEETVQGLLMNWLKHTSIGHMRQPVTKSFQTLAAVLLAILIAAIVYDGVAKTLLFAAFVALATMTFALVIEIGLVASRQAEMAYEESYGLRDADVEEDETLDEQHGEQESAAGFESNRGE